VTWPFPRKARHALSAGVVAAFIVTSCAQRGSPTGGPSDETPPQVTETFPVDSAFYVAGDTRVRIVFSEQMKRESVERSLFIAPYPDPYPLMRWSRGDKRVELDFGDPLLPDQTYVMTLGTDATDAHGTRLDHAHTFAFSTGTGIDSGLVTGSVWADEGGIPNVAVAMTVGLYRLADSTSVFDPQNFYSDYQTQTGSDGEFTFGYLSPGMYRVFAWDDGDGNSLLDTRESLGIPPEDVVLTAGDSTVVIPPIRLASYDNDSPVLHLLRAVDREHVEVQFDENVASSGLEFSIVTPESLATTVVEQAKASATHIVHTPVQTAGTAYGVSIRATDPFGNAATWAPDTTLFDGITTADTSAPRADVTILPQSIIGDTAFTITLWFDDLISAVDLDSLPVLHDSVRVAGQWFRTNQNTLEFHPEQPIGGGSTTWRIPTSSIGDSAGNSRIDTLDVVVHSIPADSLGDLNGTVSDLRPEASGPVGVQAVSIGDRGTSMLSLDEPGSWRFTRLPAGRYRVIAWRDSDANGRWSAGKLDPFEPAERWVVSDTISVRPRWERAGVNLVIE
jgi:uncharacterized protein (DUF2141 family)